MLRFLADENLNGSIVRGLLRRNPSMDLVRVQDVGLSGASDPKILEWASVEGRILVTHDLRTIPHFAYERIRAGKPVAGVCTVRKVLAVSQVIEDLLLLLECTGPEDWSDRVFYLPI